METKWAPDPFSHVEPNNWLEECSLFPALGYPQRASAHWRFEGWLRFALILGSGEINDFLHLAQEKT